MPNEGDSEGVCDSALKQDGRTSSQMETFTALYIMSVLSSENSRLFVCMN